MLVSFFIYHHIQIYNATYNHNNDDGSSVNIRDSNFHKDYDNDNTVT